MDSNPSQLPDRLITDRLLTYADAARYLGLRESTLRAKVLARTIPFIRLGTRATRFRLSELDAWIDSHRQPADTAANDQAVEKVG